MKSVDAAAWREGLAHTINGKYDTSVVGHNFQKYPFADVPPRVVNTDGFIELYVTPKSLQTELMLEANAEVAAIVDKRLQKKGLDQATIDDLTTNLGKIQQINARLGGRAPIAPEEIRSLQNTNPVRDLGKLSLKERIASTLNTLGWQTLSPEPQPNPFSTEAHLTEFDARQTIDNLAIGAQSLQRQARKSHIQSVLAAHAAGSKTVNTAQTDINSGLGHKEKAAAIVDQTSLRGYNADALTLQDRANFLMDKSDAMRALHDQLAGELPPAPDVTDWVNQAPQYMPGTSPPNPPPPNQ